MTFQRIIASSLFCLATGLLPVSAHAGEVALGLAGVDEGDDRYRPATAFQIGLNKHFVSRIYSYGRELGDYSERTLVTGFNYRFLTFGKNTWGSVGGSALMEETVYEPGADTDQEAKTKRQFNAGMSFGLSYRVPFDTFYLAFNWDAHLYLAGPTAGLFLSTGRKHLLGITTGVAW